MRTRSITGSLPSQKICNPTDELDAGEGDRQPRFPSARNWTQNHLDSLDVIFNRRPYDLNHNVLKVKSKDWTREMRKRMTHP